MGDPEITIVWADRAYAGKLVTWELTQHSECLITWAAITLLTRRITRASAREE